MESGLKWRFRLITAATVLAIYSLSSTFLSIPSKRVAFEEAQMPIPGYFSFFPKKGINLGLDLRGGVYSEFEVELEEGVTNRLDLIGQDILRDLRKRAIEGAVTQDPKQKILFFTFQGETDLEKASERIEKDYKGILIKSALAPPPSTLSYALDAGHASRLQEEILGQALQSVRNRVDRYGLAEPTVQSQGKNRIVVELPGVKDPDRAIKIIQQAGQLEFKLVHPKNNTTELVSLIDQARKEQSLPNSYSAEDVRKLNEVLQPKLAQGSEIAFEVIRDSRTQKIIQATPYLLSRTSYITGQMLKSAAVNFRQNEPYVAISFNPEGTKNFAELTKAHVKEYLAILLDGYVMKAPIIKEPILTGDAMIELGYADRGALLKEAQDLSLVLQEGALPARLKEATKTVVGPTLGKDSIERSFKAMLWGALLVILFMALYYKWSGVLANAALLFNILFTFALLAMFQATLTLPGMAGIILSIGMAVDANVLILERVKEELRAAQQPRAAISSGYSNAMRAILDSNITTLIAAIVLYQFGTGPIRGFAVTLIIGLVCSMFTAIVMTRAVYDYVLGIRKVQRLSV